MNVVKLSLVVLAISIMAPQCGYSQSSKGFDADYNSFSYVCDGRVLLADGSPNWEYLAFRCAWSHKNPLDLSVEQRNALTKSLYETQLAYRAINDSDLQYAKKFMKADAAVQAMQDSLTDEQIQSLNSMVPEFIVKRIGDEEQSSRLIELLSKSLSKEHKKMLGKSLKEKLFDVVKKLRAEKWEELVKFSPEFVKDDFEERSVKSDFKRSLYQQMDFELDEAKRNLPGEIKSKCLEKAKEMDVELVAEIKTAIRKGWKAAMKSLTSEAKNRFTLTQGKAK